MDAKNGNTDAVQKFSQQVEAVYQRIGDLYLRGNAPQWQHQVELLAAAFQELNTTLEELRVAEEELRQQNEELAAARQIVEAERQRYQDLFEFAPDGYLVTTLEGVVQEANRAATSLLNLPQKYLIGKPLISFVPEDKRRAFRTQLNHLSQSSTIQTWEVFFQPRNDFAFEAVLTVAVLRNQRDQPIALRWMLRDITKQKQAEAEIRSLNAELEQRVVHRTAQLEAANQLKDELLLRERTARMIAETAEQRAAFLAEVSTVLAGSLNYEAILPKVARLVIPYLADYCIIDLLTESHSLQQVAIAHHDPIKEARLRDLLREYPHDQSLPYGASEVVDTHRLEIYPTMPDTWLEAIAADPEQQQRWATLGFKSVLCIPLIAHDQLLGVLSLVLAESNRNHTTHDLVLAEDLARRIAVTIDNARLYRTAEAANRMKDEFLATLSHELRTPLNALLGWSRLLRSRKFDETTTARALESIERNARSQSQLVEDLLDVARIIRGKLRLNFYPVDLNLAVEAAIENARLTAEAKSIRLTAFLTSVPCIVLGDADRLQQILWNLVSNAIKFTPSEGQIAVHLQQAGSCIEVRVVDTGKGIRRDFLPYVFDRFRQADSTSTRSYGGLGLGLAIVRHLVELHGGTIRAESQGEDQGSTFILSLPIHELAESPGKDCRQNVASLLEDLPMLSGLRILTVDDEMDAQDLVMVTLAHQGAEVLMASSTCEAIEIFKQQQPSLLISDIAMPDENGYTLIHQVRELEAQEGKSQTPAIALTAYATAEACAQALSAGFQMHLSKPVEPERLVMAIATLAGQFGKLELS